MRIIENQTPYLGKIKIKLERSPYYTGGESGVLNKVHIDFGFIKLVSRMIPIYEKASGNKVDPAKVELIVKNTGGSIGTHQFGEGNEFELYNSFLACDGTYIGNIESGWWYYKNKFKVYAGYPHGVAEVYKEVNGDMKLIGYHGYSHRGGNIFKIGDRLFDGKYDPKEEDYEEWQWSGWEKKLAESIESADDFDMEYIYKYGISSIIPFNLRGAKKIENMEEAAQAAINMSKYLG